MTLEGRWVENFGFDSFKIHVEYNIKLFMQNITLNLVLEAIER